jgi:hypothetical protein
MHEQMRYQQMIDDLQRKRDYDRMYGSSHYRGYGNPRYPSSPYDMQQSSYGQEPLTNQQEMLLDLFDEFVTTPDGKALAAALTRFSRFVQSRVDRSSQQ